MSGEATQYTEYDPDLANAMLDEIMPEKDAQGYRLGPDGKRFTINFMVADVYGLSYPDVMQMVQEYAKEVGIDIQIRTTDKTRLTTMWNANEQDAYIWSCVGGLSEVYTDVRCYMPYSEGGISSSRPSGLTGIPTIRRAKSLRKMSRTSWQPTRRLLQRQPMRIAKPRWKHSLISLRMHSSISGLSVLRPNT